MDRSQILTARQIKVARALLDWSQEDLSEACGLSIATIRKLELGFISPRHSTTSVIRETLERAGVEFLDGDGARRRAEDIVTYKGASGIRSFIDDITDTVRRSGGDVFLICPVYDGLLGLCTKHFEALLSLNASTTIKCLHTEVIDLCLSTPRFEHRFISRQYVDPLPFCVYGNKLALIVSGANTEVKVVVMGSTVAAQASRRQFYSMWEKATPLAVGALETDIGVSRARA